MKIHAENIYTETGFDLNKTITIEDGIITAVTDGREEGVRSVAYLAPGFFDVHNHGGEGFDSTTLDGEKLRRFLECQAEHGVTDILITLLTGEPSLMREELAFLRDAMARQASGELGGCRIRGVHLEGPFLNAEKAGAQDLSAILAPDIALFDAYLAPFADMIKLVTVAPEREGAIDLVRHMRSLGIHVQAGHTAATAAEAEAAFDAGLDSVCHTFNACPPIHHREPGLVGAALADDRVYCEAICDLVHLHPTILKLIYACKGVDRMVAISDSTLPMGLPDGRYFYADSWVGVKNGERRCENGALNGGLCYLDGSLRHLVSIGIPLHDAMTMTSVTPWRRLGECSHGQIVPGAAADLVGLDESLFVCFRTI